MPNTIAYLDHAVQELKDLLGNKPACYDCNDTGEVATDTYDEDSHSWQAGTESKKCICQYD